MRTRGTVIRLSYLVLCGWLSLASAEVSHKPRVDSVQAVGMTVADMERAYRWLWQHKVEHASSEPQRLPDWNSKAAGITAFYFRDPDGHYLEILQFPPEKGDSNDLVHWQTTLLTRGLDGTGRRLLSGAYALISPGVVALPDARLGFRQGLLVRDPDGHAVQLIEP